MRWLPLLVLWTATALAQPLEIIPLQHRQASQLLPQLAPFVEPGGTLNGVGDKLFLRASPRNREEIRQLVGTLDTPPRRLVIRLRFSGAEDAGQTEADLAGRVVLGGGRPVVQGTARLGQATRSERRTTLQEVQTIEDAPASIMAGQSLVLPMRQVVLTPAGVVVADSLVRRDLGSGFIAVPHLAGERVTLTIRPVEASAGSLPGTVNTFELFTTVSGRLGEWLELGEASGEMHGETTQLAGYATQSAYGQRRVFLQVEELH